MKRNFVAAMGLMLLFSVLDTLIHPEWGPVLGGLVVFCTFTIIDAIAEAGR